MIKPAISFCLAPFPVGGSDICAYERERERERQASATGSCTMRLNLQIDSILSKDGSNTPAGHLLVVYIYYTFPNLKVKCCLFFILLLIH